MLWLFALGCSSELTPLWTGDTKVPINYPTPSGFNVSPFEANQKVWESKRLSLKHIWHIYKDNSNYYIIDSFVKSNSQIARSGIIVDGQTGEIKN